MRIIFIGLLLSIITGNILHSSESKEASNSNADPQSSPSFCFVDPNSKNLLGTNINYFLPKSPSSLSFGNQRSEESSDANSKTSPRQSSSFSSSSVSGSRQKRLYLEDITQSQKNFSPEFSRRDSKKRESAGAQFKQIKTLKGMQELLKKISNNPEISKCNMENYLKTIELLNHNIIVSPEIFDEYAKDKCLVTTKSKSFCCKFCCRSNKKSRFYNASPNLCKKWEKEILLLYFYENIAEDKTSITELNGIFYKLLENDRKVYEKQQKTDAANRKELKEVKFANKKLKIIYELNNSIRTFLDKQQEKNTNSDKCKERLIVHPLFLVVFSIFGFLITTYSIA